MPMSSIEFTYFKGVKARGEPTRIALHASKVDYKDTSVSFDEFKAGKEAGKYGGGLPVMTLPSGKEFGQSLAMVRYAAKLGVSGLYPTDPEKAFLVDCCMDTAQDALTKAPSDPDMAVKIEKRTEYAEGKLKHFMSELSNAIGDGPFVGGSHLTIADLVMHYYLIDMIQGGRFDGVPKEYVDAWPNLASHGKAVTEHPIVKSYQDYAASASPRSSL